MESKRRIESSLIFRNIFRKGDDLMKYYLRMQSVLNPHIFHSANDLVIFIHRIEVQC